MTPDNAGQNVLADLDRLEAKAGEEGHVAPLTDALSQIESDHLRPLLAALSREHQKWLDRCLPNEGRKFRGGELAGGCHACQALAAVGRDIAKALGE